MSLPQICKRLDTLLKFMEPYWLFVNCHMVNYLTDQHWQTFVPMEIQEELQRSDDIQECIESVFWTKPHDASEKFPKMIEFLQESERNRLQNFQDIVVVKEEFERSVLGITREQQTQISIKEFLSEKKRHEVEITARLVNDIIQGTLFKDDALLVDAGDGKGYLSSRLALEYGHKVLGIDSNPSNTENALERNKKLKKAWNGLKERAELESKGITPPRRGRQKCKQMPQVPPTLEENNNYKTVERFITTDLNLANLISDFFPDFSQSPVVLTGLHTCGNLAATCLQLFHHQPQCKILCNIGCCYHLLQEMYSGQEFFGNKHISDLNQETGFPLSSYMQNKRVKMGRNARMLAAQSIERTKAAKDLPHVSLFYRALFEILVCETHPELKDTVQVGKLRKFNNFEEYVDLCTKKYPMLNIPRDRIMQVARDHEDHKMYLDIFYLLRMTFAPVLESIILLDRLLFLHENGHAKSFLVPAFDAVVSPRRFAIISIKE